VLGGDVIGYRLLGPLEVTVDGTAVDLGGLKQRALLAILLLHANQPVHRDVLVDQLWGEHPPAGAEHAVNVYIWRLRKALQVASGTQRVLTRQGAYLLQAVEERSTWRCSNGWRGRGGGRWRWGLLAAPRRCLARRWRCGGARR
jgi:Transcriptional regulatory protein, C terminal